MIYAQRHLVWLTDPHDPITDAMLVIHPEDGAAPVEKFVLYRGRSLLPHADITMPNPGFARWAPGAQRAVAIVESVDGTMATARVLCRGVIRDLPENLGAEVVTIAIECYPEEEELADARDAVARAWIAAESATPNEYTQYTTRDPSAVGTPYRDGLFGRLERIGDDLIENRTLHHRHDPVTWAVTVHDDSELSAAVNIGENYDPASFQRSIKKGAVRQIKMKLIADLTPEFTGSCDVARVVDVLKEVTSLTGYQQQLQSSLAVGYGWTMQAPITSERQYQTNRVWTGDVFDAVYRVARQANVGSDAVPSWQTSYSQPYSMRHYRYHYYDYTRIFINKWLIDYKYSQPRREIAELTLDVPIQDITGTKQVLTLPSVTLSDLYSYFTENYRDDNDEDPLAPEPFQPFVLGKMYLAGERMAVNGETYEALADVDVFWNSKPIRGGNFQFTVDPRWKRIFIAPPAVKTQVSFFDQPRGLAAIAHALIRMRTKALDLLMDNVSLTVNRDDFPRLHEGTEVFFLINGSDFEPMKTARGRLKEITEELSDEGDTVTLLIELGKGTGADSVAASAGIPRYTDGGGYFASASSYLRVGSQTRSAGPDVEWTLDADELVLPIDHRRLSDPLYALLNIDYSGSHTQQIAAIEAHAETGYVDIAVPVTGAKPIGGGGGAANVELPTTKLALSMLSLVEQNTIERVYRVLANLLWSPRGANLSPGEDP